MLDAEDAEYVEGLPKAEEKLTTFFRKICGPDREQGFRCVLTLDSKSGEKQIGDYQWELGDDVETLVSDLLDKAREEAESRPGVRRFAAKIPSEGRHTRATFQLKYKPAKIGDDDLDDEDLEDYEDQLPTARGQIGQAQQHAQVALKLMLSAVKDQVKVLTNENRKKDEKIEELERKVYENMEMREDLISMGFARKMEVEKFNAEKEQRDRAMGILENTIAPLVINRLMPGAMAPATGPASPIEAAVTRFLASVRTEQYSKLAGVFEPDQLLQLVELKNQIDAKKFQEEAEATPPQQPESQQAPPPHTSNGAHPFANHPFAQAR